MDLTQATEFGQKIDREYPVEKLEFEGVLFWPFIKEKLVKSLSKNTDARTKAKKSSKIQLIKKSLSGYLHYRKLKASKEIGPNVFFSFNLYYERIRQQYVNKFFAISAAQDSTTFVLDREASDFQHGKTTFPVHTDFLKNFFLFAKMASIPSAVFQDSKAHLKEELIKLTVYFQIQDDITVKKIESIVNACAHIYKAAELIKNILQGKAIDEVQVLSFYSLESQACVLGANLAGIKTADVQHGPIGKSHRAYAGYSKLGKNKWQLLPDTFKVWSTSEEKFLNTWLKDKQQYKVQVLGNPWHRYINENLNNLELEVEQGKTLVLLTLQPIFEDCFIEDFIWQLIADHKDSQHWFLRLHPAQFEQIETFKKEADRHGVSGAVNIDTACSSPLPSLIMSCDLHISYYSGAIREAALLGKPNIVLSELGQGLFEDLIAEGKAHMETQKNAEKLNKLILKLTS